MTQDQLKDYYCSQLQGLKGFLKLPTDMQQQIKGTVENFRADLDSLERKGVNTSEARGLLKRLKM